MPSNRFDTPYGQQYVSQYVQAPLSEISGMAKEYSDKYKQAEEDTYKLNDLMAHVNAIDEHSPYKKALSERYHPKINELADKIIKGTDLPTAKRDLNKLQREFANDPLRQELEKSYVEKALYQKDRIAKGDKYGEWQDPTMKFKGTTADKQIEPFRYTGMGEVQNHAEEARKQMADIGVDAAEMQNAVLGTDGIIRDRSTGKEHILSKKVEQLSAMKVPSFLATKEGLDFARMIQYKNPNIDIEKAAQEYLYNAGSNQIFSKSEYGNKLNVTGLALRKYDEEKAKEMQGLNQSVEGLPMDLVSPEFKALKESGTLNDKGEVDFSKLLSSNPSGTGDLKAGDRIAKTGGWLNLDLGNAKTSTERAEKLVKVVQQAGKVLGYDPSTIKSGDFNKILNEYNGFVTTKGYMGNQLTGAEKDIITKQTLTDPSNYEFLDNKLQVSKDAQESKAAIYNKDTQFNINSRVNIDGKSYLQGTVTNKETGETTEVYVRPKTKEYNQHFDNVAKVAEDMKGYYTGKTEVKKSDDPTFPNASIISQTSTDNGKSIIRVYKNPNDPNDTELVVKYDLQYIPSETKGKYDTRLTNRSVLGNSFKEYQQGEHVNYGQTGEGLKMYENVAPKKIQYELNTDQNNQ